ncbi:hypothetical protein ACJMK2_014436 [Sinanodonta woodiana]|uniref:Tubulin delta chain n=1 Tax=Sinanodonta woodiana TaxID=1069815 RepID=A0ABD3V0N3_SINWO
MSTVFVQVGQCGNQIGHSLFKKVAKDDNVKQSHSFMAPDGTFRAVAIDSEPKVLHKVTHGQPYRKYSIISGKRGRGTNWAMGYHGLKKSGDDKLLDSSIEAIRKEVERCSSFSGLILLHSLSGGTGSGLGSRLCEALRDEYQLGHLMSCAFVPHASGESPLQHYNSLLTLSHLQRFCDCIVLTHNDDVLNLVEKKKGSERVSFSHLNEHIAASLGGILLPTDSLMPKSGHSIGQEPWEMIRSVCPMPSLKFVQLKHLSRSKVSWEGLMSHMLLTLKKYNAKNKPFYSLANLMVARGDGTASFQHSAKVLEEKIKTAYNPVPWNPYPVDIWTASNNTVGQKNSASVTIATNSTSVVEYLDVVLQRSKVMYDAGAYLHWYWKYGATKDDFEEAFSDVEAVVNSYNEAIKSG